MKIFIPLNGAGLRFTVAGHTDPKPLIPVLGKPMILRVLESLIVDEKDEIYIIHNENINKFNFQDLISHFYKKCSVKYISLPFSTRGAAETVLCGLNNLEDNDLSQPVMLIDGDTIYKDDIVGEYKKSYGNKIYWFEDDSEKPIYSYISLDEKGNVRQIKEKEKISNCANTGAYCFESAYILKKYCIKALDEKELAKNEFYISGIYRKMLADQLVIGSCKVEEFYCVGTPEQLQLFTSLNLDFADEKKRFCFDLDNTLVSYPRECGNYKTVNPILPNISLLKFLKSLGHTIIIYTARRMRTHGGNIGKVSADIAKITFDTLERYQIPYDEIYFGKPYAHFYIDDCAVNTKQDIQKQIGYYNFEIPTREFNSIQFFKDSVIKRGKIEGERFWYRNMPNEVTHLFPKILKETKNQIEIERVHGAPLSHLYVNNSLTINTLKIVLNSLGEIHTSKLPEDRVNIYANYSAKLQERYSRYNYSKFSGSNEMYDALQNFFASYQAEDRAIKGVVHGDPVFTNMILQDNNIIFIDMRGKQGSTYTIVGDVNYDLAKVYQSIVGYDFILHNKGHNKAYLENMTESFAAIIGDNERLADIKKITASLFFSLIPLHDNENCSKYYSLAKTILCEAGLI